MKNLEIEEKNGVNVNETLAEAMAQLVRDAENVIEDIGEEVRQELADEITIITEQFEKTKKQIMEKARKNADEKSNTITDKIREALTNKIKQASTDTISAAIEQADYRLEDLIKLPSEPATRVDNEVSINKAPTGQEAGNSRAEGENVIVTKYVAKVAKKENTDEIPISSIIMEDEAKPKPDFDDW